MNIVIIPFHIVFHAVQPSYHRPSTVTAQCKDPLLHNTAVHPKILLARSRAPSPSFLNLRHHAYVVLVVPAAAIQTNRTQALGLEEGGRVSRVAVAKEEAGVEAEARVTGLCDLVPVVTTAAGAHVISSAHC